MRSVDSSTYLRARPAPSLQPYELASRLQRFGVRFEQVGSTVGGGPARDLDIVLDLQSENLTRLHHLLEEIGLGRWPRALQRLVALDGVGHVAVHTTHGPLDIHTPRPDDTSPNGLGRVESEVVQALLDLSAVPGSPIKTSRFLNLLDDATGIHPTYGWRAVLALARSWEVICPLITFEGNIGTPYDPPADPRYTLVELSALGHHVALGETGRARPLPVGLVIGDHYAGGSQPGFAPTAVSAAMLSLARDPGIGDAALFKLIGQPVFPTGCGVSGPISALLEGRAVTLALTVNIKQTGPGTIELSGFPPTWGSEPPDLYLPLRKGVRAIRDLSQDGTTKYVIATDSDIAALVEQLRSTWPLHVEVPAALPGPWRDLATRWLRNVDATKDLATHFDLLET